MQNSKKIPASIKELIDCSICVVKAKIENNGEDSYYFSANDTAAIAGVFDGCGGSGAKKYENYCWKTGAYMAARVVAGAAKDWFDYCCREFGKLFPKELLKIKIKNYLKICEEESGSNTFIKGTLTKSFPTTAAITILTSENDKLTVDCLWAGDSRCYLLTGKGLMQLSEDDLGGIDPMENLTEDGVLTNVISASNEFSIHSGRFVTSGPAMIFSSTDGCFGYLSTPMEFEYLIVNSIAEANSVVDAEAKIAKALDAIAGDDCSLIGFAVGYGSFSNLKKCMSARADYLYKHYICGLEEKSPAEKNALWQIYKEQYMAYCK